jgi:hypothetical protein
LNEEAKRTAHQLLNRTELKPDGVEIPYRLKPGIGARTNFVAAFQMVNEAMAKRLGGGKKRQEWTADEFVAAIDSLPEILNALVREIRRIQDGTKG